MRRFVLCTLVAFAAVGSQANAQILPEGRLGGPAGTDGNWGIITYLDLGVQATEPVEDVVLQVLDIDSGDLEPGVVESDQFPIIHHADPDNAGGQGARLPNDDIFEYPGQEVGLDDNDFISVAHGRLNVQEAGLYTFSIQSDDGMAFRIFGAEAVEAAGGQIDPDDSSTVFFRNNTGNTNTLALYQLEQGTYSAEYMMWERGGGAYMEIASASGNHMAPGDARPQWIGLGDPTIVAPRVEIPDAGDAPVAILTEKATVSTYTLDQADQPLEFAREVLFDSEALGEREISRVQVSDNPGDPAGCPFGRFNTDGAAEPFPGGTPGDDFGSIATGTFIVDDGDETAGEELAMLFHVDSDDRSYFRINGQDFDEVDGGELDGDLFDVNPGDGVGILDDSNTCNTDYTGSISLMEGEEYTFELVHTERGGNAGFQVLAAIGDDPFDVIDEEFTVLSTGAAGDPIQFGRNVGIGLVAEDPAMTDPTLGGGVAGDFNGNGMRDVGDLDLLTGGMASGDTAFDLNGDGNVNFEDRRIWVEDLSNTFVGDANFDGQFNSSDFVTVFGAAKYEKDLDATWAEGDWNGDNRFNSSDFVAAFSGGGYEDGPRDGGLQTVPEPSSIALMLIGLLGLANRRR